MKKKKIKANSKPNVNILATKNIKRYLGVSKLLAPVLVPFLFKAISSSRDYLQNARAKQLGVEPTQLDSYFGLETKQNARVFNLKKTIAESKISESEKGKFLSKLNDISATLNVAKNMSASNKKTAISAVNKQLNTLEKDILFELGI